MTTETNTLAYSAVGFTVLEALVNNDQAVLLALDHFVNLHFRQLLISSPCHFANLHLHQLAIYFNLLFCPQFMKCQVDKMAGWQVDEMLS